MRTRAHRPDSPAGCLTPFCPHADAPWCGHCKKLAPTYEKIANYFHRRAKQGVHVGKIDATEHAGLVRRRPVATRRRRGLWARGEASRASPHARAPCPPAQASRFDIKGYPTLILYRDGQKVADYTGARTFDAIVAWVEQHEGKDGGGGGGGGGQAAPAAPTKATSRGGRPSAGGRTAKAGPGLRTWLLALLTEHDPVSVGLTMLGVAGLFWCAAPRRARPSPPTTVQPASLTAAHCICSLA